MRLGFSVRVFGAAALPSADLRPQHQGPHLSLSLAYLRDILVYLRSNDILLYRLHSRLLPLPRFPQWSDVSTQLADCRQQLRQVGQLARDASVRLSFHTDSAVTLNAPDQVQVQRSRLYLECYAALLSELGAEDGLIVCHVGGVYDNLAQSAERFVRQVQALSPGVRDRLALEHDDRRFDISQVSGIHQLTGLPLVFDNLHHQVHNPARWSLQEALARALDSWPSGKRAKVHFSTPRSEMRGQGQQIKVPTWTEHGDFCNPFEFERFAGLIPARQEVDIMLEARARDLALLKLRQDLARFAPETAAREDRG